MASTRPSFSPPWAGRPFHRPIELGPLSAESERDLLEACLEGDELPNEVAAALSKRSEGNPLFVLEQARMLRERGFFDREGGVQPSGPAGTPELDVPATVEAIIAARIDALPQSARQTLQAAAVIGDELDAELLSAVLEREESEVRRLADGLVDRDLLREEPFAPRLAWRFHHALLREVAQDRIAALRRKELHGRVASALEQRHEEPLQSIPDRIGWHLVRSDRRPDAFPYLREAAERALAAGAMSSAVKLAEEALTILREGGDRAGGAEAECELHERLVNLHAWSGDRAAALAAGKAAIAAGEAAADPRLVARGHLALAEANVSLGTFADALEELDLGETQAAALADDDLLADLRLRRANALVFAGRIDEADSVLDGVEASGEVTPTQRLVALRLRAIVRYRRGETEAALKDIEEGLALAEAEGERVRRQWFVGQKCNVLLALGRSLELIEVAREGIAEARRSGLARSEAYLAQLLAYQQWQLGHLAEALEGSDGAVAIARDLGEPWYRALAARTRGLVLHETGRHGPARAVLREGLELTEELAIPESHVNMLLTMVRVETSLGMLDDARAHLDDARESTRRQGDKFQDCERRLMDLRRRRVARMPGESVGSDVDRLLELARECEELESLVPALCEAARVLAAAVPGSAPRARELAEEALRLAEAGNRGVDVPVAQLAISEALRAAGEVEEARRHACVAVDRAREQGQPEIEWEAAWARDLASGESGGEALAIAKRLSGRCGRRRRRATGVGLTGSRSRSGSAPASRAVGRGCFVREPMHPQRSRHGPPAFVGEERVGLAQQALRFARVSLRTMRRGQASKRNGPSRGIARRAVQDGERALEHRLGGRRVIHLQQQVPVRREELRQRRVLRPHASLGGAQCAVEVRAGALVVAQAGVHLPDLEEAARHVAMVGPVHALPDGQRPLGER